MADTDTDRAVALYRDAITAQPALIEHYCRFADLLADLGDIDQMHAVLTEAGRRAPESPRVFTRRMRCADLRGAAAQDVLELCDSFLTIEPENENAMLQRGNALLMVEAGAAIMIEERELRHPEVLLETLRVLLADPAGLQSMAAQAKAQARPGAAERIDGGAA